MWNQANLGSKIHFWICRKVNIPILYVKEMKRKKYLFLGGFISGHGVAKDEKMAFYWFRLDNIFSCGCCSLMLFFARIVFSFVFGYCNVYKMSIKQRKTKLNREWINWTTMCKTINVISDEKSCLGYASELKHLCYSWDLSTYGFIRVMYLISERQPKMAMDMGHIILLLDIYRVITQMSKNSKILFC